LNVAYVDTSVLVAVAFAEPGAKGLVGRLASFDRLLASNLLEAEFQSALDREGFSVHPRFNALLEWATFEARISGIWPVLFSFRLTQSRSVS